MNVLSATDQTCQGRPPGDSAALTRVGNGTAALTLVADELHHARYHNAVLLGLWP